MDGDIAPLQQAVEDFQNDPVTCDYHVEDLALERAEAGVDPNRDAPHVLDGDDSSGCAGAGAPSRLRAGCLPGRTRSSRTRAPSVVGADGRIRRELSASWFGSRVEVRRRHGLRGIRALSYEHRTEPVGRTRGRLRPSFCLERSHERVVCGPRLRVLRGRLPSPPPKRGRLRQNAAGFGLSVEARGHIAAPAVNPAGLHFARAGRGTARARRGISHAQRVVADDGPRHPASSAWIWERAMATGRSSGGEYPQGRGRRHTSGSRS